MGDSPDPPPMAGTLPAAARAHLARFFSGLNRRNRRVVAVMMHLILPLQLRMQLARRRPKFAPSSLEEWLLEEVRQHPDTLPLAAPRECSA